MTPSKRSVRNASVTGIELPIGRRILAQALAWTFWSLMRTYRVRVWNDPRGSLGGTRAGRIVVTILHAHQLGALSMADEASATLVSRSKDGQMLVPLLERCRCLPICGSTGGGKKGGARALTELIRHVRSGKQAVIAVDGPRGPRGRAQKGCAMLAQKADGWIVPVAISSPKRWMLRKTWDRFQICMPFSKVSFRFGEPIRVDQAADLDVIADRVSTALWELESRVDPSEAQRCRDAWDAESDHAGPGSERLARAA
ncbi:MAG: DUF374 domain-containing protein [Planctomycetota bacterium]